MPIDKFGYYSLIVPFIDNYYRISEIKLAQSLATKISKKYSGRLNYFSSLKTGFQYEMGEEIVTEIERYRTLMEAILFYFISFHILCSFHYIKRGLKHKYKTHNEKQQT